LKKLIQKEIKLPTITPTKDLMAALSQSLALSTKLKRQK
jgi:hypothetical protein